MMFLGLKTGKCMYKNEHLWWVHSSNAVKTIENIDGTNEMSVLIQISVIAPF